MNATQLARFVRLFVFALVPALVALASTRSPITVAGVITVATPALETAWRQRFPAAPARAIPVPPAVVPAPPAKP